MGTLHRLLGALVVLHTAACSSDTPQPAAVGVRDSAGIRIVTVVLRDTIGKTWSLSAQPITRVVVMSDSNGPLFQIPRHPFRTENGDIVFVAQTPLIKTGKGSFTNRSNTSLAVFDPRGSFVRTIGRAGNGPGEFNNIIDVFHLGGDSVVLMDLSGRASVMSLSGQYVRSYSSRSGDLLGRFSDGSFVVRVEQNVLPAPGVEQTVQYARINDSGAQINAVTEWLYRAQAMVEHPTVWAPIASQAVSDSVFYYTAGGKYEIQSYTPAGKLVRILRIDRVPRRTTAADVDSFKAEGDKMVAQFDAPKPDYDRFKYAESFAAIEQLVVDKEGNLWIREGGPTQKAAERWLVFDRAGAFKAFVSTPAGYAVEGIGRDYVLGVCDDEDYAASVCVYALNK